MDARKQRGLELAATRKIRKDNGVWFVPSQSSDGTVYRVHISQRRFSCDCPDHETRHIKCKHIYAATFVMKPELNVSAASRWKKAATRASSASWMSRLPPSRRTPCVPVP